MGNDSNFDLSGNNGNGEKWTEFRSYFGAFVHRDF